MNSHYMTIEQGIALVFFCGVVAYLAGAATHRFAARAIDTTRRHLGRVHRVLGRVVGTETRVARSAAAAVRAHNLGYLTDLDAALRVIDGQPGKVTQEDHQAYDFSLEESLLKRDGHYFRCIRIPPEGGYIPDSLTKKMTDATVQEYLDQADGFFNHHVPLQIDEKSLYDDAEAAVIVSFFRNSDRRCFYVLNEMRKTINGNIWRLVKLFSVLWLIAVATLVWAFSNTSVSAIWSAVNALASSNGYVAFKDWDAVALLSRPLIGLIVALVATALIAAFQTSGYKLQQEHSARELNWFLSRWLDRISDRYREALAQARGATVGEEKDTRKVAAAARTWHKVMIWMAFRSFFIESFYRNIRFQIDRNRSYYDTGPAIVLLLGIIGLPLTYYMMPSLMPRDVVMAGLLALLLAWVSIVYWRRYHRQVVPVELDENWLGFANLELGKAMDEVVGAYGEEVGYWKNRTGRSE